MHVTASKRAFSGIKTIRAALEQRGVSSVGLSSHTFAEDLTLQSNMRVVGEAGSGIHGRLVVTGQGVTVRLENLNIQGSVEVYGGARLEAYDCTVQAGSVPALYGEGNGQIHAERLRLSARDGNALRIRGRSQARILSTEFRTETGDFAAVCVEDDARCTIIDSRVPNSAAVGVYAEGRAELSLDRLHVEHAGSAGIRVIGQVRLTASNCRVEAAGQCGVRVEEGASGRLERCSVHDSNSANLFVCGGRFVFDRCEFVGTRNDGSVAIGEGASAELVDCIVSQGHAYGVCYLERSGGRLVNTIVRANRGPGLWISAGAAPEVSNCRIENNEGGAVRKEPNSRARFDHNGQSDVDGSTAGTQRTYRGSDLSYMLSVSEAVLLNGDRRVISLDHLGGRSIEVTIPAGISAKNRLRLAGYGEPGLEGGPDGDLYIEFSVDDGSSAAPDETSSIENDTSEANSFESAMAAINVMVGLEKVKASINEMITLLEVSAQRKALGVGKDRPLTLHAIFLGNPGTGKTTMARHLGAVFKAMGLLQRGHVVEADRSMLISPNIGETAVKTRALVDRATDGVLFVDEAYTLIDERAAKADYGQEAVDTLLKLMEDRRSQLAVIAAGYPERMLDFLESNPGLKGRFSRIFVFEDYAPAQLMQIFDALLRESGLQATPEAIALVAEEFAAMYEKRDNTFANARMVREWMERLVTQQAQRLSALPRAERTRDVLTQVVAEDVLPLMRHAAGTRRGEPLSEVLAEVDQLIGLAHVKEQLHQVSSVIDLAQQRRRLGLPALSTPGLHSLYLGRPGTGKTTVARLMGRAYRALGVLERGHVIVAERKDLVAGYVGQTAIKTERKIKEALGGVLFIDEAYTLARDVDTEHAFGREAIDTLLTAMETHRDSLVVIAAGYPDLMLDFLRTNPGLASRFPHRFEFDDYSPNELRTIFEAMLKKEGLVLTPAASDRLDHELGGAAGIKGDTFSNARFARNVFERSKLNMAVRVGALSAAQRNAEVLSLIEAPDIPDAASID